MRLIAFATACLMPLTLWAEDFDAAIDAALDTHVLPGVTDLAEASAGLATTAETHCASDAPELRAAYNTAFDAWMRVSHLRFGPSETDNRAFALAFWPDGRGVTPRTLSQLIGEEDPVVGNVDGYAEVSVAGRGFYAMEFLLYDPDLSTRGSDAYRCALIQVIAADIAATTAAILEEWEMEHASLMREAGSNDRYQSDAEAMRALFNALTTGLEFNADVRLGRPLGTFDRPRPNRAEARRSERSVRNITLSTEGLAELAAALTVDEPGMATGIAAGFDLVLEAAGRVEDPVFANVADPQGRLRVEALQQRTRGLRQMILTEMGPSLGISAGFNALDGD
ncbi:MAG: imelysin family protein [Pseudomonadota bacterium]